MRVSSRPSSPPSSAWRHAAAKPGASSASPSARASDGAWESPSTSATCRPPRASSTASSIATVERPGAPAGPQTAMSRGRREAADGSSSAAVVGCATGRAVRRSASCQASTSRPSAGSSPNDSARRASAGAALSGTIRTARRSHAATTDASRVLRVTSRTTASASARRLSRPSDRRAPPSAASARAEAETTAITPMPSASRPPARSLPCGSSTAIRTLTASRRMPERWTGPTRRPSRRASRRHPLGGSRLRARPSLRRSWSRPWSRTRRSRRPRGCAGRRTCPRSIMGAAHTSTSDPASTEAGTSTALRSTTLVVRTAEASPTALCGTSSPDSIVRVATSPSASASGVRYASSSCPSDTSTTRTSSPEIASPGTIVRLAAKAGTVWRDAETTNHTPATEAITSRMPRKNRASPQKARDRGRALSIAVMTPS